MQKNTPYEVAAPGASLALSKDALVAIAERRALQQGPCRQDGTQLPWRAELQGQQAQPGRRQFVEFGVFGIKQRHRISLVGKPAIFSCATASKMGAALQRHGVQCRGTGTRPAKRCDAMYAGHNMSQM